jgi:hypothetical protein
MVWHSVVSDHTAIHFLESESEDTIDTIKFLGVRYHPVEIEVRHLRYLLDSRIIEVTNQNNWMKELPMYLTQVRVQGLQGFRLIGWWRYVAVNYKQRSSLRQNPDRYGVPI